MLGFSVREMHGEYEIISEKVLTLLQVEAVQSEKVLGVSKYYGSGFVRNRSRNV